MHLEKMLKENSQIVLRGRPYRFSTVGGIISTTGVAVTRPYDGEPSVERLYLSGDEAGLHEMPTSAPRPRQGVGFSARSIVSATVDGIRILDPSILLRLRQHVDATGELHLVLNPESKSLIKGIRKELEQFGLIVEM